MLCRGLTQGLQILGFSSSPICFFFFADTDVYFAEDPYPILHSPLLAPFEMVVRAGLVPQLAFTRYLFTLIFL